MQNPFPVISPILPFPPIYWWQQVVHASAVLFDKAEHFEKMSYRNRYYIATANGKHCLSIPIVNGRDQRKSMMHVRISTTENWQQQHWRTIFSAYNRSPYFEFYKDDLEKIFVNKYDNLIDFNFATIHWVKQQLRLDFEEITTAEYQKEFEKGRDLRTLKPQQLSSQPLEPYSQVFADRHGFISQLSILDLVFNEGRSAIEYLKN